MAFRGTSPIPTEPVTEAGIFETREIPRQYNAITYVVHASETADCDRQSIVKEAINNSLDGREAERVVFILPPDKSSYLTKEQIPTDVRSDADEINWVKKGDIKPEVQRVTLIGGGLQRCLAGTFNHVIQQLETRDQGREATISLPLDSIYTLNGKTASTEFLELLAEANDQAVAIVALLISISPFNYQYGYGEIPIIRERGLDYELRLNGAHLLNLFEKDEETPVGWIQTDEKKANIRITLDVTASIPKSLPKIEGGANLKIPKAREIIEKAQS